jgi:hypothetical protein
LRQCSARLNDCDLEVDSASRLFHNLEREQQERQREVLQLVQQRDAIQHLEAQASQDAISAKSEMEILHRRGEDLRLTREQHNDILGMLITNLYVCKMLYLIV